MRKEVEDFLNGRTQEEAEARRRRREAHLIELGLYRTEFLEDMLDGQNEKSSPDIENEYVEFKDGKRCRKAALDVTDEEYAAICEKEQERVQKKGTPVWPVHQILFVLAMVLYGMGLVMALGVAVSGAGYERSGVILLSVLGTTVLYAVGGTLLLAASEIVRLMKKNCGEL